MVIMNPEASAGALEIRDVKSLITEPETKRIIETCRENNCPYEFVLKDISTVTYKPQNLINWVDTVMSVIDSYY